MKYRACAHLASVYAALALLACSGDPSSSEEPSPPTPDGDAASPSPRPPAVDAAPPDDAGAPDAAPDATPDAAPVPEIGDRLSFSLTSSGPSSLVCVDLDAKTISKAAGCEFAKTTDLRVVMNAELGYVDLSGPTPTLCPISGTYASLDDVPTDHASRCSAWYASLPKHGSGAAVFVRDGEAGARHWRVRLRPVIVAGSLLVELRFAALD